MCRFCSGWAQKKGTEMGTFCFYELAVVAAAIGWIDQFSVYAEEPAARNIYVGCLLNVDHII